MHETEREKQRISDILNLVPENVQTILDAGAREGFISRLLVDRCASLTALDLTLPKIEHPRIKCVQGDLTRLNFSDDSFDLCFCAEVLEHIPSLSAACSELARVSRRFIVLGVPFRQDLRVGKSTCQNCGAINPPWGHVNSFDKNCIAKLFPVFQIVQTSFVGTSNLRTNFLSSMILDAVGNPWGNYEQEEPCIRCGKSLASVVPDIAQRAVAKVAYLIDWIQSCFLSPHANWMHVLLVKN